MAFQERRGIDPVALIALVIILIIGLWLVFGGATLDLPESGVTGAAMWAAWA